MRILYHHRTLGDGAEGIHIHEMVNAFRLLGHEVSLVGLATEDRSSHAPSAKWLTSLKRHIRGPLYECIELAYNIVGYYRIRRAINYFKPDIIYDRYIAFNYSSVMAGRHTGIPTFLEVNAPLAYERSNEPDEALYMQAIAFRIEKLAFSNAFRTIVVSSPLKEYLFTLGVPESKIIVLPNGVNLNTFSPRPKSKRLLEATGLGENNKVIGFTGILRPWHGVEILLKALQAVSAAYPESVLLIVGDGPIRSELESQARRLGLQANLRITGRVPHREVPDYLALFDVAVSPKATFYASPMKIMEYMAMAKPVVAPRMKNVSDILEDHRTGLLFEPDSPQSLAEALLALFGDANLKQRMAENGLAEVTDRLNWIANARYVERVVKDVAAHEHRQSSRR
jgi:glycosyltransferase involved in cell wall biosynthesis